jgi:phosphatidylserine/phosphatidylglycerophosphate/cardiolipin synthase-like enzyme
MRIGEFRFAVMNVAPGFSLPDKVAYEPNIDHLSPLIQVVADLICSAQHPEAQQENGALTLSLFDRESLHGRGFFPTVIEDAIGIEHLERLILHLIPHSKSYSKFFIFVLRDGILKAPRHSWAYVRLISLIQDYVDEIQYLRVDTSLLECLRILKRARVEVREVIEAFLKTRVRENELVRRWLERHLDILPPLITTDGF